MRKNDVSCEMESIRSANDDEYYKIRQLLGALLNELRPVILLILPRGSMLFKREAKNLEIKSSPCIGGE